MFRNMYAISIGPTSKIAARVPQREMLVFAGPAVMHHRWYFDVEIGAVNNSDIIIINMSKL